MKAFVIHLRISELLYDKILAEGERLGMSQTEVARYAITRYFEELTPKRENKKDGGEAA